jgi:protein O-mannosyl-transferase
VANFSTIGKRNLIVCLLLTAGILALYNRVSHAGFLRYDDDRYVVENPYVRAGIHWSTIAWAFTTFEQANWHPLTWLSHALDCQLLGLNPSGHHYVNLLHPWSHTLAVTHRKFVRKTISALHGQGQKI